MKEILRKLKKIYLGLVYSIHYLIKFFVFICLDFNKEKSLETKLLLAVHSIEKGFGIQNTRMEFGKCNIEILQKAIVSYEKKGYKKNGFAYLSALSILETYIKYHLDRNIHDEYIESLTSFIKERNFQNIPTGFKIINNQTTPNDYLGLIKARHSIRAFSDKHVDEDIIINCIKLAQTAPTACNRQTVKVYYTMDKNKINSIGELMAGNKGFTNVNNYLVITSDVSAYTYWENGQWMTNAGIFIYSLVLALEYYNIGNCILQWIDNLKKDKILRKILNIPTNEHIVASIAIGHKMDEYKILYATRKDINDILVKVD